jgi:ADP-ribosylglycohydrolase
MLGAIAGDIIGSRFELHPLKSTEFNLLSGHCCFTDDTVLTVALADAILTEANYTRKLKEYCERYPLAGYGASFVRWANSPSSKPYNSFGNGAAMRISPVGFAYDTLGTVLTKAIGYTAVTHNHPEGIKGAQATAMSIFMARTGATKEDIREAVEARFEYDLSRTLDQIRPRYEFDESCQGTVPEAIIAFLESEDYESAIRNAISLGGDADTLACITGGIAQAFYGGVPDLIAEFALSKLDDHLREVTLKFMEQYRVK